MKTFKKIISILLIVVMCLTSAPLQGFVGIEWPSLPEINLGKFELPKIDFREWFGVKAEAASYSGTCGDNLTWSLDTDTGVLTIRGSGSMWGSQYSDAPWFSYRKSIKSVSLPNGLTSIRDKAFENCTNLESITIPNGVTSIGHRAFIYCSSLKSIIIPNSVTSIGGSVFENCTSLENVTISNKLTSIRNNTFTYCKALTNVIIPDSVTSIGGEAFYSCTSLESITIGNNVSAIGSYAFAHCTKLTSITIPNSVTSISMNTFSSCTSLTNITIPNSVTSIGSDAFSNCTNLQTVYAEDIESWLEIDFRFASSNPLYYAKNLYFNNILVTEIEIPDNVTSIKRLAFSGYTKLTSVTIPNSVTSIGDGAFSNCTNLTSITIPNSVTSIGSTAFYNCTSLTSITIPDSVTSIGYEAFYSCTSLASIRLPNSITSIGNKVFYNCTSLRTVTILGSITSIGYSLFCGCTSLKSVTIPNSVTSIGSTAFYNCTSLTDVYYEGSETEWSEITIGSDNTDLTDATIHYNSVMSDGGSDDDTPTSSENFKFEKSSYIVKYDKLTEETNSNLLTLIYQADESTLKDFDINMINFTVGDPSILAFDRASEFPGTSTVTKEYIYCLVMAKKIGTTTLTATLPDGTTANCEIVVEEYTDDAERFIQISSTNRSLRTEIGESFRMSFTLMEDGIAYKEREKVSVVVGDPTVISVYANAIDSGGHIYYIYEVTGLKAGSTNVIVSDSDTGTYETFNVNVYEPYTQNYNFYIEKWESFYPNTYFEKNIETYVYDLNGLYVNNYQWTKAGDKYFVSFDIYNQSSHIGSVDVYDAEGNWYNSYEIKKLEKYPESVLEWAEDVYYIVNDYLDNEWFNYEDNISSQKTSVFFEVPVGGYFTISNNALESIGVFLFNFSELLFYAAVKATDEVEKITSDKFSKALKDIILKDSALKNKFIKIFEKTARKMAGKAFDAIIDTVKGITAETTEKLLKEQIKDGYVESTNLIEEVLKAVEIKWTDVWKTVAEISQSGLELITGPVGKAVDKLFNFTELCNMTYQIWDMALAMDAPYITIHTLYNGEHIDKGIRVESNGRIDAEAVLQVFRVSTCEYVEVTLDEENPLAIHEIYNICFVKNDKLVQPNGKVKVYIPIPEDLKRDTCLVYRQEANNNWTALIAHREGDFLVFETDHFSLYAIVGEKQTISIATKPNKTTYLVNDILDSTGLTLKVGDEIIDSGFICSPSVLSKNGKQTITVTYMGLTAEFEVEVNTKTSPDDDYQVGDIIQFGSYPQSKVTDSATISALNKLAPEWESWNSYGYYSSDNAQIKQGDWMRYTDIIYNGDRYRGVKFTKYRPSEFDQEVSIYTYQDSNGYYVNEVYWFKFEPICWRVLDSDTGLIMCESIIDSQPFNNLYYENNGEYFNDTTYKKYASDYETSSIRKWLHENFYNTAFTENEKKEIDITVLNNDGYLTSSGSPEYEKYDGDNTSDKIFCLSYNDAKNDKYGFNSDSYTEDVTRRASGSDYAKSQGLDVENDGYSRWLLRSPYTHRSNCLVNHSGWSATMAFVSYTSSGVRPALTLKDLSNLDKEDHIHDYIKNVVSPTCEEDGYTQFKCKCGDTYVYDYVTAKGHSYSVKTIRPTCTENGTTTYTCACGDAYTETISATGHTFDESESKCKNCDYDKADDCSCNCHKGGIKAFFFKLILFFQKIFKTNKVCKCGKYHY